MILETGEKRYTGSQGEVSRRSDDGDWPLTSLQSWANSFCSSWLANHFW
jgi:hypothetical protein